MIQVHKLTKRFGAFLAVDHVSFEVAPGEIVALVGPNGSGKSTTMKCIAGLIAPSEGEIMVNGASVVLGRRDWLSYLPQKVGFPENLTGREVASFYSRLRKLPAATTQRAMELSQLNGFGGRAVREYSVGMLQRLGIAIVLTAETPIVVLDEPTAGLDPDAVLRFRELLVAMRARGQAVIVSTHVLSEAETLADRVAILMRGRLVACEPIRAFRERLAQQSRMRIALRQPADRWRDLAISAGAVSAEAAGSELLIGCPAESYLPILHALERDGASIQQFATEEAALETLYLRYIHENSGNDIGDEPSDRV